MFRHLLGHDRKLRSLRHGVRRPSYQRSCQPQLERLEDRLAPATHFWSGEGDPGQQHKWSNDDNWDNGAPGGDSDAVLDYPSDVRISLGSSSDDYPGEISIRSIVFHRAGYFVGNAAGSSAYLIDNIGALNEDGNNVFNLDMRLPDGQHVFEVDGNSGSLELSGRLTGGGEISKEGEGTLILDGDARAYYGLIVVNNGGVQLSSPGVLSSDNTISVREQGALELTSGDFTLRHLGEVRGGVYLSQGASLPLEGGMTHFYKGLSGDDADRGLNLTGNARVTLDAYNPFEGPVRISSGTLQMDGTLNPHAMHSPWTVDQGGRLTGRGEVPDVLVSGSVIPGDPPEESGSAPGVLYTKNVSFLPGSSFAVRLNGYEQGGIHGYDQLRVLGRVDLSGSPKLDASVGFASKPGDTFPILTSTDGITGTFAGLPDGTNFGIDGTPMQIHYTATSVVLTHRPQFAPPVTYAAGRYPILVATGDLRGNGIKDLVTASAYDGTVSVLLGNGDGTFQAAVTYPASQLSTSLIVGDFNGDGNLDLVTVGYPAGVPTVSVLLGNGDGTFQAAVPSPLDRRAA